MSFPRPRPNTKLSNALSALLWLCLGIALLNHFIGCSAPCNYKPTALACTGGSFASASCLSSFTQAMT
jgi:hypothetical protein